MTETTPIPPPSPQQEANNAHYALTKAVREMLPKFCKDPNRCHSLIRSEAAIQHLISSTTTKGSTACDSSMTTR